jgi:predicted nucleotidyltransferase
VGKQRKKAEWRAALDDFVAAVKAEYGDRLERIVLYGSRARGDATEDSDVDVMVILKNTVDAWAERHHLRDIAYRVTAGADRWDTLLSVMTASEGDFENKGLGLYRNVRREGLVLA